MVAKILDHNNKGLQQGRRGQQREQQKRDRFILAKQQICTCVTRLFLPTWNFLVNTAQNFLFLNSDTMLSHSTPENFAKIQQIKLNKIDEV